MTNPSLSGAKRAVSTSIATLLAFGLLLGCATTQPPTQTQQKNTPSVIIDDREIIALVNTQAERDAVRFAANQEGYRLRKITRLPGLDLIMISFDMPPDVTGKQAIAALEDAVPASTVGVNHAFLLQQDNAGKAGLEYANSLLEWPLGGCPALGPIGVIDTGIDKTAPGLRAAKIISQKFFEGRSGPSRHGTEVATVLADPDRLSNVTIYGANVFEDSAEAGLAAGADSLVRALDWMAQSDVRVVNLALAGPYNKLLDLAVSRAAERGLIMVAAVGNDGPNVAPQFPAGFEDVIAVTAIDAAKRIMPNAVRGSHVDIAAPGVEILVASSGASRLVTGTSIATPFVAARIVADPDLFTAPNGRAVRRLLRRTTTDLGATGFDPLFGAGLMQAKGLCKRLGS